MAYLHVEVATETGIIKKFVTGPGDETALKDGFKRMQSEGYFPKGEVSFKLADETSLPAQPPEMTKAVRKI